MVSSLQATEDSAQRALASEILLHLRCQQGPGTSENRELVGALQTPRFTFAENTECRERLVLGLRAQQQAA